MNVKLRLFRHGCLNDTPETLENLSQQFNISRERVRQIEVRAFEKLQNAVREKAEALNLPEND